MANIKKILSLLGLMLALALSACAHESTVQPSKGHIDGQVTAQSSTDGSKASTANIPKPVVNNTYLPPPKFSSLFKSHNVQEI